MANRIIPKKSSVAAKIPLSTDLSVGELAINLVDKKIYSKDAGGNVVELGGATVSTSTFDQVISTNNGNGTNFKVGDDVWIGDINTANTMRITGQQDATRGYIVFGNSDNTALGRAGTGALTYGAATVLTSTTSAATFPTLNQNTTGSAATLTTARTLTIGSTGKAFDGSANVSWSLSELGAAATNQTMYIGTTAVAINRASASLSLTGVSVDGSAGSVAWSGVTGKPTTLSGYGITDAQPASTAITTSNYSSYAIPRSESKDFGGIYINPNGSGVCTTAEFITHLTNLGFFDYARATGKCAWDYAGSNDITDTGFGQIETAGCVIETWVQGSTKHVRITRPTTGSGGFQTLVYNDQGGGYSPGWRAYITSENIGSQSVNYATTAGRAYPRRGDGGDLNFYWSGQSGQPPWLWGGSDGQNMYVYNPSNFSVNYATTSAYSYHTTQGFNSNWNTDFQEAPAGSTILRGDTSSGSSTGGPGGTWWFQQNMRHTNSSNYWGVQVAWGWEDNANILRTRNVQGGSFGGWVTYLNSANVASYALPIGGGNLTGGLKEAKVTMGANDIALGSGNYFSKTISGATTLTVSGVPSSGTTASFILDLTNGGSGTITWWSGMKWAGGTAPTLTASGRDVLGFFTHDGGTTWTGLLLGKDVK